MCRSVGNRLLTEEVELGLVISGRTKPKRVRYTAFPVRKNLCSHLGTISLPESVRALLKELRSRPLTAVVLQ